MERNSGDKIDVLKTAKALLSGNVPEPHSLVHAARQYEVIL